MKVESKFHLHYNLLLYNTKNKKLALKFKENTKFINRATDWSQSNCPPHPSTAVNRKSKY